MTLLFLAHMLLFMFKSKLIKPLKFSYLYMKIDVWSLCISLVFFSIFFGRTCCWFSSSGFSYFPSFNFDYWFLLFHLCVSIYICCRRFSFQFNWAWLRNWLGAWLARAYSSLWLLCSSCILWTTIASCHILCGLLLSFDCSAICSCLSSLVCDFLIRVNYHLHFILLQLLLLLLYLLVESSGSFSSRDQGITLLLQLLLRLWSRSFILLIQCQILSSLGLIVDGLIDHVQIIIVLAGQRLLVAFLARCKLLGEAFFLRLNDLLELLSGGVVAQRSFTLYLLLVYAYSAPLVDHKVRGLCIIH